MSLTKMNNFSDLRDVVEISYENAYLRNPVITLTEINNGIFATGNIPEGIESVDIPSTLTPEEVRKDFDFNFIE